MFSGRIDTVERVKSVGISMCFSPQHPGLVGPGRTVERKLINLLFIRECDVARERKVLAYQ
jgi:hypothetical protein